MKKSKYSKRVLEIAAMLDVPKATVDKVRQIKKERPDLLEKIEAGYVSIDGAMDIIREAREVVLFPPNDMKEAAVRLAEAYRRGMIFRPDFNVLLRYLEIEFDKVDEEKIKRS